MIEGPGDLTSTLRGAATLNPMPDELTQVSQELRVAVGRVARRLRRISAEGDAEGAVKFNELLVLLRLSHQGALSPSDIARHEQVTSQAIARAPLRPRAQTSTCSVTGRPAELRRSYSRGRW